MSLFSSLMASQEPGLLKWFDAGDAIADTLDQTNLTLDGASQSLDLRKYFKFADGVNPILVLLRVSVKTTATPGSALDFFKSGESGDYNISQIIAQVNNIYVSADVWVPVVNGMIGYAGASTLSTIDIVVGGYFALV